MHYNPTFERSRRLQAITQWAKVGVMEGRLPLPIEEAFQKRVAENTKSFFKPVAMNNLESVEYHRELSYLIDAFDSLPRRVDQAFDSIWKAFELETKQLRAGNITERLEAAALNVESSIVSMLCALVPVQTCEYAYKRLVTEFLSSEMEHGLVNRVAHRADPSIREFLDYLRNEYGDKSPEARRKGALLLRRALRGENLVLAENQLLELSDSSRARFLVLLVLYSARNERFHGSSFSPFVSSNATLRTYTHPYFLFLASYYLLLGLWLTTRPQATDLARAELLESMDENFQVARDIFGSHWSK